MHALCIVVGDKPHELLAPFAEFIEVHRFKHFMPEDEVRRMAAHFGLPAADRSPLAARMREWQHAEGGVEDGRLFFYDTANPDAKYDWFAVGGRYAGYFRLRTPRQPAWWQRVLGKRAILRVNQARKADVDTDGVLSAPPAALLIDRDWHECPLTDDAARIAEWSAEFARRFAAVPDSATLTAVDFHS
jgi:hypothetical protein